MIKQDCRFGTRVFFLIFLVKLYQEVSIVFAIYWFFSFKVVNQKGPVFYPRKPSFYAGSHFAVHCFECCFSGVDVYR